MLLGDLDDNGAVEVPDIMEACKALARAAAGSNAAAETTIRGDLDGDGLITITDVMEICKLLARQAA